MSRPRRPAAALATVAVVALICAGCGSGSAGDEGGATTAPAVGSSNTGGKNATKRDRAVRFSECVRANGVSAFPDPDASGDLTVDGVVNGSSVDPDGAGWKQAIAACKDLQPPGFTGSKATPEQMSARLRFAQCVRANGVEDFPDPTKDGPLVDTNRIPSSAAAGGMSILNAAMKKCSSFASEAGVRPGQ